MGNSSSNIEIETVG